MLKIRLSPRSDIAPPPAAGATGASLARNIPKIPGGTWNYGKLRAFGFRWPMALALRRLVIGILWAF
jgi:hypothetical protein